MSTRISQPTTPAPVTTPAAAASAPAAAAPSTLQTVQKVVDFCRERDMSVVHDFAYADMGFDGHQPPSPTDPQYQEVPR